MFFVQNVHTISSVASIPKLSKLAWDSATTWLAYQEAPIIQSKGILRRDCPWPFFFIS